MPTPTVVCLCLIFRLAFLRVMNILICKGTCIHGMCTWQWWPACLAGFGGPPAFTASCLTGGGLLVVVTNAVQASSPPPRPVQCSQLIVQDPCRLALRQTVNILICKGRQLVCPHRQLVVHACFSDLLLHRVRNMFMCKGRQLVCPHRQLFVHA